MPNQNQIAWDAMMGKKYQQGKSVKSNIEADRADLIEGRMTGEEFRRRHGEYKPDLTGATDLMKPKKRLYFHPKTGKKITKAEYDKYLSKAKGGKIKYQEGGPIPKMEAVKRLVEMWKPKTKEGKLYDDQLARAVMALGGVVPEGRRMYGTKKKKKSLQTADVGPVRGYAKGGKVKMPKGWHV